MSKLFWGEAMCKSQVYQEIDFDKAFQRTLSKLEKKGICILATSVNDKVTARSISIVIYDEKIAFQTSENTEKFQQIEQNQNVGLSIDNFQIIGQAKIKAHPFKEEKFIGRFKQKHAGSFKNYSDMKSERVVEVIPLEIKSWTYIEKEPFIMTLNVGKRTAFIEAYKHSPDD